MPPARERLFFIAGNILFVALCSVIGWRVGEELQEPGASDHLLPFAGAAIGFNLAARTSISLLKSYKKKIEEQK